MRTKKLFFAFFILIAFVTAVHADPTEEGKRIFISRCSGCHNINKILTGPALAGVDTRHSIEWIINFVHSSQTVVKSGDKDANTLYQKFNKITMPDHPDLTADNIKSIIEYIKSGAVAADTKAPFAKPAKLQTPYLPLTFTKDYPVLIIYLLAVAVLIGTLLFAVRLNDFSLKGKEE